MTVRLIATPYADPGQPAWIGAKTAPAPPPPPCPYEFTKNVLGDVLDRRVESPVSQGILKVAVDVVVSQVKAPACQWVAAAAFIAWGFS